MKRGINEENIGPMFPRLHVNDTEKGGPRAPPRNKMALYEQLSIPSQRFSNEVGVSERGSFFPHQQKTTLCELNMQLMQQEQKKQLDKEDFRVPIYILQSEISGNRQNKDNEALSPYNSPFSGRLTNVQKASERNKVQLKETNGSSSFGHRSVSNNSIRLQSNNSNSRVHVVDSVDRVSNESIINGDDVSENSMIDSISGDGISPDDVVGIIGQKHFWKARRAIVNQQKVFAVQVFELHRLIKVQRLIAGLPQLMIKTNAFLGKPTKVSQIKKIPLDYVIKSSTNLPKIHEKSKVAQREFSAENAVEKGSLSSVQNSCGSMFTGYPLPPPDPKMGPWSFSQQTGHQWLIPVMSPSEGLIYKPYPAPGYMTPGPGPPHGHNFVNHGVPPLAQPHYQWPTRFQPLVHPLAHGYFPPYGMTTMNPSSVEEMSPNPKPNPFSMQYQSSCNVPTFLKFHGSNNEVLVSTASSPSERTETCDALPLFPTCPPAEGHAEATRAIKVVPCNARLATESVARIFRSIQQERKRQDPV